MGLVRSQSLDGPFPPVVCRGVALGLRNLQFALAFQSWAVMVGADGSGIQAPKPPTRRDGYCDDPDAGGGASACEPPGAVPAALPALELGAGQWRAVRHGLPGFDAGAASWRAYHAAARAWPPSEPAGRAAETGAAGGGSDADRVPAKGSGRIGVSLGAADPAGSVIQRADRASSLSGLHPAGRRASQVYGFRLGSAHRLSGLVVGAAAFGPARPVHRLGSGRAAAQPWLPRLQLEVLNPALDSGPLLGLAHSGPHGGDGAAGLGASLWSRHPLSGNLCRSDAGARHLLPRGELAGLGPDHRSRPQRQQFQAHPLVQAGAGLSAATAIPATAGVALKRTRAA